MGNKQIDQEEFIRRSTVAHGDRYDYSQSKYTCASCPVQIVCREHGPFETRAHRHWSGSNCRKCVMKSLGRKSRLSTEEFIERSVAIHGDKYDYSKVVYRTECIKVCVICRIHGEFFVTPGNHRRVGGCRKCRDMACGDRFRKTSDYFLAKARAVHGDKYDYSLCNYVSTRNAVQVVCRIHGQFTQVAGEHLRGHGCPECGKVLSKEMSRMTFDEFMDKAVSVHGDKYTYSRDQFSWATVKTTIVCNIHGPFTQMPYSHLLGCGCPSCKESTGERDISLALDAMGVQYDRQKRFSGLSLQPFDFYVESHNLLIEFDGRQHFEPVEFWGGVDEFQNRRERDEKKNRWAWENGYMLMRIPYWMQDRIPELLHCQLAMFCTETAA